MHISYINFVLFNKSDGNLMLRQCTEDYGEAYGVLQTLYELGTSNIVLFILKLV